MLLKLKRCLASLLALCMGTALLAGCDGGSGGGGGAADTTFTYWISAGVDSSYYADYRDSPVYTYYLNKSWPTSHGDVQIDFDFQIPVTGSEADNFNTLLATGEYADIMELSRYTGSIMELYEEGTILDLTEYVEKYMPNYMAWLDAHPDAKLRATQLVDGEPRYLTLHAVADIGKAWCGYMYRRDWILKYGTSPVDGSTFSGEFTATLADGTPDGESWQDNIVFPSGGPDPVYVSDWEWMLDIFQTALAEEGITDGYGMSIYYPGYLGTGDLVSGFGGGGPSWYKDPDGQVHYGATEDHVRVYLQAMSTWYENGWLDKAFAEHSSDMFYRIDEAKVRQGKVGVWIGLTSQLFNTMDAGEPLTEGIMVYPATTPINDVYGTAATQNKTPYTVYSNDVLGPAFAISDKAAEKDLEALFLCLDYMYSDEGALVGYFTAEQVAELNQPIFERYGLEGGTYDVVDTADGSMLRPVEAIRNEGGNLKLAIMGARGLSRDCNSLTLEGSERWEEFRAVWITYPDTGNVTGFIPLLPLEDAKAYSKIQTQTNEFLEKNVPGFINGSKDPFNDNDWNAFVNAVNKYNPDSVSEMIQSLIARLQG